MKAKKSIYKYIGWVSSIISIVFIPIFFGAVGIISGLIHKKYEKKQGNYIVISSIICMLLGTSINYYILFNMNV